MTMSVIVPCYWASERQIELTEKCLHSLSHFPVDEIIVVDDGSPLEDITYPDYPNVIQLHKKENGGYASAVNAGLAQAIGEILIVSNNDVEFIDPYWLHHITEPLTQGYDICSVRTTDSDGWSTADRLEEDAKFGSIWAMRREVYEALGDLDESFGNYFEDLDYHERAKEAGFKVVKNHRGLVQHIGKATFKEVDPDDTQFLAAREKFKEKWGKIW